MTNFLEETIEELKSNGISPDTKVVSNNNDIDTHGMYQVRRKVKVLRFLAKYLKLHFLRSGSDLMQNAYLHLENQTMYGDSWQAQQFRDSPPGVPEAMRVVAAARLLCIAQETKKTVWS